MTVIHTFNFIDLTYNNGNTVNIRDINNLSNFLGVQNQVSVANIQNAIKLMVKDYNMFVAMTQLYNLVKMHSKYDSATTDTTENSAALYLSTGVENDALVDNFLDIEIQSAYSYITKTEQILTLSSNISQNNTLKNQYIMATNKSIAKKLLFFRSLILAYTAVSGTSLDVYTLSYDASFFYGFCPIFNVWSSIAGIGDDFSGTGYTYVTYFFEKSKAYITPLLGNDITFLRFFSRLISLGINNLLVDIDNQNAIITYGIDILQVIEALGQALDVTVFQDTDIDLLTTSGNIASFNFALYVATVNRILNFCIPIINDVKNKVLMNGLPSYYILYTLFTLCMLNIRNDMILCSDKSIPCISS
jgi:hypothetical protein